MRRGGRAPLALLADPNPVAISICAGVFLSHRYGVEHAPNGAEALAKAIREAPDIVVADAALPVIDGFALCELLRRDPATSDTPVIVVSSDLRQETRERAWRAGVSVVLPVERLGDSLWEQVRRLRDSPGMVRVGRGADERPQARPTRGQVLREVVPPPKMLRCPRCDTALVYERSYLGGVRKLAEQWDEFTCPSGCGQLEYRHRTRSLRRAALPPDAAASQK